ncbi:MAG TPA: hypothetical protein VHT52_03985 [Stellaceae bacterium]|nr:hypothetical protein [Stellaceae bacterium]
MAKFSMCSPWTSINVLMLNYWRVVVKALAAGLTAQLPCRRQFLDPAADGCLPSLR